MGKIKRILSILLCTAMLLPVMPVHAKKSGNYWPKLGEKPAAGAALLMNVDTGVILYQKNIDKKYYPASITKILTTLLAVENSSMDETVTFSEDAVYKTEGSGISRDIGEKMTMEECLYAVMLESANECAYAVAEHVAGSVPAFVAMMNEKAKELGCTSSYFNNPHGLPDEDHYVTARDMALIARAAYQNETFRLICGTKRYTIPPTNKHKDPTYMFNHHKMLYPKDTAQYLYDYCTGGKTGYTQAAGNTLVTYAEKDGMTLLTVVLASASPQYWMETRTLMDYGFDNYSLHYVADNMQEYGTGGTYDSLNVHEPYAQIDSQARIILPKTVEFQKAVMKISYDNLPDGVFAQLQYSYGKHKVGTADIIRTDAVIAQDGITMENDTAADGENVREKQERFSLPGFWNKVKKACRGAFQKKTGIIFAGIVLGIVIIIIILKIIVYHSNVLRQRIAGRKNRKWTDRKYTVIRDTRTSRGRRRKKRR